MTDCVADSIKRMIVKDPVCRRSVQEGSSSQNCERSALPVVRAAHAVGVLLYRRHLPENPPPLVFVSRAVILLCSTEERDW